MKVAITCDYLFERNHYTEIIESLCEIFPEATLYCFAHKAGAILGTIEQRPIRSTHLSTIVKSEEEFYQHSNKLPSLAKNLFVSCQYDLIINVSKGFSQGLNKCKTTKLITYLYDLDVDKKIKKTFLQKLFFPFIKSWINKTLGEAELVLTSRAELMEELKSIKTTFEVMPPPFRVSDYSLFPKGMFKHHFFLIEAKGLTLSKARELTAWMKEWNYQFQFLGPDEHLNDLKKDFPENTFFGSRCSGEHAPVMAASKAFVSFNAEDFPANALATLATGRPVILISPLKKWMSGLGISFVTGADKSELTKAFEQVISDDEGMEGQKLRAHVMEYHDIKFKAQMKRVLDSVYHEVHSKNSENHPADCTECH